MDLELPNARTGVFSRKVAGIPVLYLAGGGVAVLGVYAYTTSRASTSSPEASTGSADTASENDAQSTADVSGELYPAANVGTVVAAPQPVAAVDNASIETNDEWLRKGVALLIASGTDPGDAQRALQAYLDEASLTYDQGQMRNRVIREYGLPPVIGRAGATDAKIIPKKTTTAPVVVKPVPAPFPGTLSVGVKGKSVYVQRVQRVVGAKADGIYGPVTKSRVMVWQGSHGLTKDGVVGKATWTRMFPNG